MLKAFYLPNKAWWQYQNSQWRQRKLNSRPEMCQSALFAKAGIMPVN